MDAARFRTETPDRRHAAPTEPADALDELLRPAPTRWVGRLPSSRLLIGIAAAAAVGSIAWLTLSASHQPAELTLPRADSGSAGATNTVGAPASPNTGVPTASNGGVPAASTTSIAGVVAHVAGAVNQPGVVHLAAGARVTDAVDASGGFRDDADLERINLAAPVTDGERVYVVAVGQTSAPTAVGGTGASPSATGGATVAAPSIIDLNAATAEQLDALPGVGPATASAIVDYRTKNGPFTRVEDLLDVRGIGDAKLEALRDSVTVGS